MSTRKRGNAMQILFRKFDSIISTGKYFEIFWFADSEVKGDEIEFSERQFRKKWKELLIESIQEF